jgi:hypothetical protein
MLVQKCLAAIVISALCLAGCQEAHKNQESPPAIVGAWLVKILDSPFPLHMFMFHSDGTVVQSNPDAGDPTTSDSNLMGAWQTAGDGFRGKLVEITAERSSHQFASRGEISFAVRVSGNTLRGTASATFFDPSGRQVKGPTQVTMAGERVMP